MGYGITVKCGNCSYTRDFLFGTGGTQILIYEIWLDELNRRTRRRVVEQVGSNDAKISSWSRTAARCDECGYLFDYRKVDLAYGEGYHLNVTPSCPRCRGEATELEEPSELTGYPCPKCRQQTLMEVGHILWD